jgi:hypothetical protein
MKKSLGPLSWAAVLLLAGALVISSKSPVFADTPATVTRSSILRGDHDASSTLVKRLDVSTPLTVLDMNPQNGYLHVRTADGTEGWVFARNISVIAERPAAGGAAAGRQPARHPTPFAARAAKARSRSAGACAASLDQCTEDGCDAPGTPHALLNHRKRTVPPDGSAVTLTFADLRALQGSTDRKGIGQGADIADRAVLTNLDIGGGRTISEGALVQLAGFISPARSLGPGSAESVNCRLTSAHDTDVHIPVVETAVGTEFESLVVEPIPQGRPPTWNLTLWKKIQTDGTKLLVRGQLMYDNIHRVNSNPDHPQGGQPKRFTLWEVHPIVAIFECAVPSNDCDPTREGDWLQVK